ncbi:hypothetical protein J3Q64DRAFT_1761404 [Phycomyces blakesleeanus]|uniref:Uncharacterized protein n=2 Tax=Phycomyces blakesleeanus TaxID=4837 RepID=A0A162ZU85_PHYB8|nr:hypothetical protein PHYBLDRAFT_67155 [Phycomyces blakesleeanus NRRL 1555(-)]OAD69061.1 hypothetical protein PHYBLDRAFT_67155 [Phycomyces blakesleeanus NRRL 1555(-)]|eukprot:XP_018287101.1 hypothetical protein PHYBLDRAFT_67155 [Phycomyces blakesleeanus NRRL 1555(-)]
MYSVREGLARYAVAEVEFFNGMSPQDRKMITDNGSQTLEDCLLYGEIGFVVAGLKPCVLVQFSCPERMNGLYRQKVIDPLADELGLRTRVLGCLESEEMNLTGGLIVDLVECHENKDKNRIVDELWSCGSTIGEDRLARILDYPGSLPRSEQDILTMLEVAYVDSRRGCVVTTFAAQTREEQKVRTHFERYRMQCKDLFGIDLQLIIRRPQL